MRIAGLQPFTLCDFPDKVAAIIFTAGCNYDCPYCHNKHILRDDTALIPLSHIAQFLEDRVGKLDGIVISGGEPTIHSDLQSFIANIKAFGYAVKLDTNGSCPHTIKQLLQANLLDYIAMDLKAPFSKYPLLTGDVQEHCQTTILASIDIVSNSGIAHEFRTTVDRDLLNDADIATMRKMLPATSTYKLQPCTKFP